MATGIDGYAEMLAFAWSVQEGNFSAAARAHDMSPSAISKLVTRLENRLAVRLFSRLPRSVELTAEGYVYYRSVRAALDAMDDAWVVGDGLSEGAKGILRIHTMPTFARHQISPWLPVFLERQPELNVEFQLGPQFTDLFDQGVDIAIHSGKLRSSSRVAKKIAASRWIICASPAYLERFGTPSLPEELEAHCCLNFGFPGAWQSWPFKGQGKDSTVIGARVSSSHGDLLRDLALRGSGIVRLAEFHISADLQAGTLLPILEACVDKEREPIYLIYANRRNLSPRIAVFAQALQEHLQTQKWNRQ